MSNSPLNPETKRITTIRNEVTKKVGDACAEWMRQKWQAEQNTNKPPEDVFAVALGLLAAACNSVEVACRHAGIPDVSDQIWTSGMRKIESAIQSLPENFERMPLESTSDSE